MGRCLSIALEGRAKVGRPHDEVGDFFIPRREWREDEFDTSHPLLPGGCCVADEGEGVGEDEDEGEGEGEGEGKGEGEGEGESGNDEAGAPC